MTEVPTVTLANGVAMPALGLGTSPMGDDETEATVAAALGVGYRLIDTAENYRNEAAWVGASGPGSRPRRGLRHDEVQRRWHGFDEVQGLREQR